MNKLDKYFKKQQSKQFNEKKFQATKSLGQNKMSQSVTEAVELYNFGSGVRPTKRGTRND